MFHMDTLAPPANAVPSAAIFQTTPADAGAASAPSRLPEIAHSAVNLDGRNLWHEPDDAAVSQLAEAVRLADLRGKTELNINNIAPSIDVSHCQARQVPILQKKIQRKLALACMQVKRPMPECRLDLSHGEYGIRCYLGRIKPTDHVFTEDMVSDSR